MKQTTVLIIDDEVKLTQSLAFALRQTGMECLEAHNGLMGCKIAERHQPDVVLLDIRMPGQNGIETLGWLQENLPDLPVVMMSAFDDTQDAVTAIKMGAVDYLSKPFDVEELILLIQDISQRRQLESEVGYLREKQSENTDFIGNSHLSRNLRSQIQKIGESQTQTILLRGETGVGKAVVARQIHIQGSEPDNPFVEINCATLPEQRIEAELFGAEKGALPGLRSRRRGLVEIADGGSLFLDEVSEMPLSVQAKLLTFLETRSYRPLGSARERFADVRVIAATNKNLEEEVSAGQFRQDLYYRLNIIPMEIPPLRERKEDIETLALYFAHRLGQETAIKPVAFAKSAISLMTAYGWPGNVRELKNLIERLAILHPGQLVSSDDLPLEIRAADAVGPETIEDSMRVVERTMIQEALLKSGGKKGVAAERLGISRHALKRKMQRLGF